MPGEARVEHGSGSKRAIGEQLAQVAAREQVVPRQLDRVGPVVELRRQNVDASFLEDPVRLAQVPQEVVPATDVLDGAGGVAEIEAVGREVELPHVHAPGLDPRRVHGERHVRFDEIPRVVGARLLPVAPAAVEVGDDKPVDVPRDRVQQALAPAAHRQAAAVRAKRGFRVERAQDHAELPLLAVEAGRFA